MKGNGTKMSMKEVTLIFRFIWTLKWLKMTPKGPQNDLKFNFFYHVLLKGNVTNMSMKEVKLIFRFIWTLKWPQIEYLKPCLVER